MPGPQDVFITNYGDVSVPVDQFVVHCKYYAPTGAGLLPGFRECTQITDPTQQGLFQENTGIAIAGDFALIVHHGMNGPGGLSITGCQITDAGLTNCAFLPGTGNPPFTTPGDIVFTPDLKYAIVTR